MNILFIGDIVGKIGRKALKENLSFIKNKYDIDFTIANGENISNGRGISLNHYNFLLTEGIDAITLGNHYLDKKEELELFKNYDEIVLPLNSKSEYIEDIPFLKRSKEFIINDIKIKVTSILGKAFMKEEVNDPYLSLATLVAKDNSDIHIIDYHAEASGEKEAMAYAFKGEISALIGTHTHVQTKDARIIDKETFYITDVGMCGDYNGILGYEVDSVIKRQVLGKNNVLLSLKDDGVRLFNGVILSFDDLTFKPLNINSLYIVSEKRNKKENN